MPDIIAQHPEILSGCIRFFMNLVQPVLNGILMQKCFFAVFFEGHIAGKINTKQFKVFRRKLIQSFLQEGFFIA